jgi:hypothetical protein
MHVASTLKMLLSSLRSVQVLKLTRRGQYRSQPHRAILLTSGCPRYDRIAQAVRGEKLLPISNPARSIAVIGPNANIAVISGGGSAHWHLHPFGWYSEGEFIVGAVTDTRSIYQIGC